MSALTPESFLAFYPGFSFFSRGVVLPEYIRQANARFGDFGEDTEEARRLFTAHKLTLYAAGMPSGDAEPAPAAIATAGRGATQQVSSKKVGEVSVTYAETSPGDSVFTGLGDLKETVYGRQLLSLIRLHGLTRYIP